MSNKKGKKKSSDQILGFLEETVTKDVRKTISSGKDEEVAKLLERFGKVGLEEYLIGSAFDPRPGEPALLDSSVAKKYYNISADKGHPCGQFSMALMYLQGTHGTAKDEKMAVKLMTLSANQGYAPALYNKAKWFLDGKMGHGKKPQKAYKLLSKAKKDPLMDFTGGGADIHMLLSTMRLQGNGCLKNPVKAQEHLHAAEKLQPGKVSKETFDMIDLMVAISPTASQQETDLRWRRLKVACNEVVYLTLTEWADLHAHYGMPFSINPSSTGDGDLAVNFHDMQEWKIKVGCLDELPETYPAMEDPLPPLECTQCHVEETKIKGSMKKCEECQAPYCSVECQRANWKKHKPVCDAISAQTSSDLTDHEQEYLRGLDPKVLKDMGVPQTYLDELMSKPATNCEHDEFGIPCNRECLRKRGAVTQNKYKYTLVEGKKLNQEQKAIASRLGLNIPYGLI